MALPFMRAFRSPRNSKAWFFAGPSSSFPNITDSGSASLSSRLPCGSESAPGCKVFQVPREDNSRASEVALDDVLGDALVTSDGGGLRDQVLVFQFRGKFHAVANQCPHGSYPLSNGTPFDIEDFGIALSAGITCAKHGWSFDLFSGRADRGNYKLGMWEVELRPVTSGNSEISSAGNDQSTTAEAAADVQEVWVRKKPRIG